MLNFIPKMLQKAVQDVTVCPALETKPNCAKQQPKCIRFIDAAL